MRFTSQQCGTGFNPKPSSLGRKLNVENFSSKIDTNKLTDLNK